MGLNPFSKGWEEEWGGTWGGLFLAPSLQLWASSNLALELVGGGAMLQHNRLQNTNFGVLSKILRFGHSLPFC